MRDPTAGKATLFVLAIRDYPGERPDFTAAVDEQIAEVKALWCAPELGERALSDHDLAPVRTRHDLEVAMHGARLRHLDKNDTAVLFVVGHGALGATKRHYLLLPATPTGEHLSHGYPTADLVTAVLATRAQHVLVVVNACFAGSLASELAQLRMDLDRDRRDLPSIAVFASGDFDERPRARHFTAILAALRANLAGAEYSDTHLSLDDFRDELRRAHGDVHQARPHDNVPLPRRIWGVDWPSEDLSPCLPNPAYRAPDHMVSPARSQVATTTAELDYWLEKATGRTGTTDPGWYFTGRVGINRAVCDFLATGHGMLMVTGAAGTGKSAILARAVTLSDPGFRADPRYRAAVDTAPAGTVPPPDSITAAVLARGKNAEQLAAHLVHILGGTPDPDGTATRHANHIHTLLADTPAPVLVIDGLDEATNPLLLIPSLIAPLLRTNSRIRLIIGVRSSTPGTTPIDGQELLHTLDRFGSDTVTTLRTDDLADTTTDIAHYLTTLLTLHAEDLGHAALTEHVAAEVAPSFLDGRFAAQHILDRGTLPDLDDRDLAAALDHGTVGLLRQDLVDCATPDHPATALLAAMRAAAFAQGAGIPRADIWPAIASAILNDTVTPDTITHLLASRLNGYLTHDTAHGRTVYRPIHESLTTALRDHPHRFGSTP
ncbi:AAA family ATPase [Actinokineospora bangkokensis]|uniref:ORC1/DEAH AAA+ ATPase domain-containing protein n=1 Tax=Actinokineospora bangkokensis TaxID=1193682 RepID=A0A1Q9LSR0_9PSEU|nr:AAA family ATPase [Actinokineospora bangkokensis]OLR95076.1 hypothetical protein BJP25_09025 [Actinokineospora bangkokensis]